LNDARELLLDDQQRQQFATAGIEAVREAYSANGAWPERFEQVLMEARSWRGPERCDAEETVPARGHHLAPPPCAALPNTRECPRAGHLHLRKPSRSAPTEHFSVTPSAPVAEITVVRDHPRRRVVVPVPPAHSHALGRWPPSRAPPSAASSALWLVPSRGPLLKTATVGASERTSRMAAGIQAAVMI